MTDTKERGALLRGQFHPNVDEFTFVVHVEFRGVPFAGLLPEHFHHTYLSESAAVAAFRNASNSPNVVEHACIIVNAYRDQEFQWEFVSPDWRFAR